MITRQMLERFASFRNKSPFESNLQFFVDMSGCGIDEKELGACRVVFRNIHGAIYAFNEYQSLHKPGPVLVENYGRCGVGDSFVEAFINSCSPGVDPEGLAVECGIKLEAQRDLALRWRGFIS